MSDGLGGHILVQVFLNKRGRAKLRIQAGPATKVDRLAVWEAKQAEILRKNAP